MNTMVHSRIKKMSPLLLVNDMDRSIEFYTKKLGFDIDFRYEDFYTGIIKDGYSIHLKTGCPAEERKDRENNEDPNILFSVEGIEHLYEEMVNKSVAITQPIREMPYGKEFYIADPDSYIIAFLEEA